MPPDLTLPIAVRYKQASLQVLENLRNTGEPNLTGAMTKYGCFLPEKPNEEELEAYRKFREDIYPAFARLKDMQAKTIEAIHKKTKDEKGEERLHHEPLPNLIALLKTIDHDIEVFNGSEVNKGTTNVFIFNNDQANRIAARLTGRNGKVDSYAVSEKSD